MDRFTPDQIQTEIAQMEVEQSAGKIADYTSGEFSLTGLPQSTVDAMSQNLYLDTKDFHYWFKVNATQKTCKDLSCMVNSLYAKPGLQGLLHYWFYLKTGYSMSTLPAYPWFVNAYKIDTVQVQGIEDERYLFSEPEWRAWWMQAGLLPKSMLHMPSLKSVHRVPRGYTPEEWKSSGVCGWALGYASSGIVLLGDHCLSLNSKNPFDYSQFFYEATTHEFGHRLSSWNFTTERRSPAGSIDSEPEFLALSGWKIQELVSKETGKVTRQWSSGKGAEFVSLYSATSPAEDFADTVGYFRTKPDSEFANAPHKYEYMKKRVFAGRGYTAIDLRAGYLSEVKKRVLDTFDTWSQSCLVNSPIVPELSPDLQGVAAKLLIDLPLDTKVTSCLQAQFALQVAKGLSDLRYEEPEACSFLDKNEVGLLPDITSASVQDLNQYFKSSERVTDLIAGVRAYREALLKDFDERATLLACIPDPAFEACYQKKLLSESERLYQKYQGLLSSSDLELARIEKARFESMHAFSDAVANVTRFYQGLFVNHQAEMKTSAETLWSNCASSPVIAQSGPINTDPYTGGAQYIAPSMLQCLNSGVKVSMADLESRVLQENGIDHFSDEAKIWIQQRIMFPYYKVEWDQSLNAAVQLEKTRLRMIKETAIDAVFGELIIGLNGGYNYRECKDSAFQRLRTRLEPEGFRYLALDPELDHIGDEVCEQVRVWVNKASK
jgi:hypothetical protein